jgi:flagellar biosynthesis protein FlhG
MVNSRPGRVISVGGGKGGVGKSVVAANLAVAMAQAGARVVVVDADLGAANQHTLFGIARPGPGVEAFLEGALPDLASATLETGIPGLRLVPGSSGVVGAANPSTARKQRLIRHVRALDADVVVVDVGAGVAFNALDLFDVADLRLVIMTPQLTSAQNAYAFMKGAVFRELRRIAAASGQQALIDGAAEGAEPTAGTPHLLARLSVEDGALAAALQAGLAGFGARLVGNQLFEPREANVIYALSRMAHDFLGLDAPVLGALRASRRIHDSVDDGRPYLLHAGVDGDECAATLRAIARTLLDAPLPRLAPAEAHAHAHAPPSAPAPPPASLPVAVSAYQRAYERHPVDVAATLVYPGGLLPVRLKDVSETGALLEVDRPPPAGTRITLVFAGQGEPSVACMVRHGDAGVRRAGVEFLLEGEAARRTADGIRRMGATVSSPSARS